VADDADQTGGGAGDSGGRGAGPRGKRARKPPAWLAVQDFVIPSEDMPAPVVANIQVTEIACALAAVVASVEMGCAYNLAAILQHLFVPVVLICSCRPLKAVSCFYVPSPLIWGFIIDLLTFTFPLQQEAQQLASRPRHSGPTRFTKWNLGPDKNTMVRQEVMNDCFFRAQLVNTL
jgi:hypothetical protein